MARTIWMASLVGFGGVLQIFGVLLIVRQIASDRRLAAEIVAPLLMPELPPTYPQELTERDRHILELRHRLLEEMMRPSGADVRDRIEAVDEALRRFIHEQLTGDIRARITGVVLIVLGLAFGSAGSLWGILSGSQ